MALDPRIILAQTPLDIPGGFQRGLRFSEEAAQFAENRALAPQRARAAEQDIQIGDFKIAAGNIQKELVEAKKALALMQHATTPEVWDQISARVAAAGGQDFTGMHADRASLMAGLQSTLEALSDAPGESALAERSRMAGFAPGSPEEQRFFELGGRQEREATQSKVEELEAQGIAGGLTPGSEELERFVRQGGESHGLQQ